MGNYFVMGPDGAKYGPADFNTLKQWALEGRLNQHTMLEDATTGAQVVAGSLPDLFAPAAPNGAPPPDPGAFAGGQPYQQPNNFANYPRADASADTSSNGLVIAAWVLSVIGCGCCPIVFGVGGIICAVIAKNKGNKNADAALIGAIVLTLVGFGVGFFSAMRNPALQRLLHP